MASAMHPTNASIINKGCQLNIVPYKAERNSA